MEYVLLQVIENEEDKPYQIILMPKEKLELLLSQKPPMNRRAD